MGDAWRSKQHCVLTCTGFQEIRKKCKNTQTSYNLNEFLTNLLDHICKQVHHYAFHWQLRIGYLYILGELYQHHQPTSNTSYIRIDRKSFGVANLHVQQTPPNHQR